MRILILGGDGMLGHQLFMEIGRRHDVRVTLRQRMARYVATPIFTCDHAYEDVDVRNIRRVRDTLADFRPEAVVNATGIVKQRTEASNVASIEINALFPHRLQVECEVAGIRLVHLSTDCVFSGNRGHYFETDTPDAEDMYGRSKLLGELTHAPAVTLRTSLIGYELYRKTGLLEWFLAQKSAVKGYRNAIFSGFTTLEMSRIIERILTYPIARHGLYHVSSTPISKHALLQLIRDKMGLQTDVVADDSLHCDRSLNSAKFRRDFDYLPPSWDSMVEELARQKGK